jgi:hypothetical protein
MLKAYRGMLCDNKIYFYVRLFTGTVVLRVITLYIPLKYHELKRICQV